MADGESDGGDDGGERDPADALLVAAHEIRLDILRALWAAESHALPFSDLRKAVGVRDTGQFNYHLSKLEGRFVAHVEDRYELLYPGHRLVDAVQSGVFDREIDRRELAVDGTCRDCGSDLAFTYREFVGRVRCPECDETVLGYPFDPGGFDGREDDAAVVRAFDRRTRRYWRSTTDGVCLVCAGPTEVTLVDEASTLQALDRYDDHYAADQPVLAAVDCQHCSFYSYVPVGVTLLDHPGVVGALYQRGVDVTDRRLWDLPFVVDADRVELVETDPLRVAVTAGPDADLTVTLDDTATVVSVEGIDAG
jgi:hypothetical protein